MVAFKLKSLDLKELKNAEKPGITTQVLNEFKNYVDHGQAKRWASLVGDYKSPGILKNLKKNPLKICLSVPRRGLKA